MRIPCREDRVRIANTATRSSSVKRRSTVGGQQLWKMKNEQEDVDIGPLLKWKEETNHLLSKRYGFSGAACVSRTDCLNELGKVQM